MVEPNWRGMLVSAWYNGAPWLWLLRPLEALYRTVVALRRIAYRVRVLSRYRCSVPVVVVGNLTVGGTGKTPVVIALVEMLAARGLKAGVVGRGYGATKREFPHIVDSYSTVEQCGDEALVIYRRTGCPCVVGPSRVAAIRRLLMEFNVDIVISDDGLQHYALARDVEVVLYDEKKGFGNGRCLPAGPLREPLARLRQATYVYSRGTTPGADIRYEVEGLVHIQGGNTSELSELSLTPTVLAIAGIAHPENFVEVLRGLGLTVKLHAYPDHHQYCVEDFASLPDGSIIMTEKDAVKCHALVGENAWYLKVSAILPVALTEEVVGLASR